MTDDILRAALAEALYESGLDHEQAATDAAAALATPAMLDALATHDEQVRAAERERLREAIDKTPSVVFLPNDIERIYRGETLPLVTRHALRTILADPEQDHD